MSKRWWFVGLALALLVAILSPLASGSPDGLERVAEDTGFADAAEDAPFELIPDYVFPGIASESMATILAGVVGTLVVFGLAYLLSKSLAKRETQP